MPGFDNPTAFMKLLLGRGCMTGSTWPFLASAEIDFVVGAPQPLSIALIKDEAVVSKIPDARIKGLFNLTPQISVCIMSDYIKVV